jgi:hypothetical protein
LNKKNLWHKHWLLLLQKAEEETAPS